MEEMKDLFQVCLIFNAAKLLCFGESSWSPSQALFIIAKMKIMIFLIKLQLGKKNFHGMGFMNEPVRSKHPALDRLHALNAQVEPFSLNSTGDMNFSYRLAEWAKKIRLPLQG